MTDAVRPRAIAKAAPRPFDSMGVLCLAWTAGFVALTAVLSLTLH